jgi:PAS domain S-box-containing protein
MDEAINHFFSPGSLGLQLFKNSAIPCVVVDQAQQNIIVNSHFCQWIKCPQECCRQNNAEGCDEFGKKWFMQNLPNFNNTNNGQSQVLQLKGWDGNDLWVEMINTNLSLENNNTSRFIQFIDITSRVTQQQQQAQMGTKQRMLFESMSEAFALHQIITNDKNEPVDYVYLDVNTAFERMTNLRRDQIIGHTLLEVMPQTEPFWIKEFGEIALNGGTADLVNFARELNRYYQVRVYSPEPRHFAVIFTDITQRMATEKALKESETRHRFITENILDVIWIVDVETARFTYVSPSVEKLRGFTPEEVTNHTLEQAFTPKSKQIVLEALPREVANFMAGNANTFKEELEQYCKDGSTVWIEVIAYLRQNESTNRLEIIGTSRDITDRHNAEAAKREIEKRYKLLTEVTNEGIVIHQNGNIVDVNPSFLRMLKLPNDPSQMVGKNIFNIISGDEADIVRSKIETNYCGIYQITIHRADNTTFPAEINASLVDIDGARYRVASIYDITERKAAEKRLVESEALFRSIFDNAIAGIGMGDLNYRLVMANKALCQIVGYAPDEILGKQFFDVTHPDDIADESKRIANAIKSGASHLRFEKRYINKKHQIVWADLSVAILRDDAGKAYSMVAVVNDITLRKQHEQELVQSLELNQNINQTSPVGITTTDANGEITFANTHAISILGLTESSAVGKKYNSPSWAITELDGSVYDMGKLPFIQIKNKLKPVYDVRHAIQWPNGTRICLSINATPVLDAQGQFNGMIATLEDITEKLKAEKQLQQTNEQLQELNRTKDRFFSIIAHDLRGSLGNITSLSELLYIGFKTHKIAMDESMAKAIYDSSLNTLNLLENLLSWANSQRHSVSVLRTKTNLSALLKECTTVLRGLAIDKQITITLDLDNSITCDTDRDMLSTIVRNLVSNAIKYSYPNSEVTVTSRSIAEQSQIEICVADKGLGMDEATKNGLFLADKYPSAKGTIGEGGTGLGLVLCHEFINKLGGIIGVESQPGKGSRFYVRIPHTNS